MSTGKNEVKNSAKSVELNEPMVCEANEADAKKQ